MLTNEMPIKPKVKAKPKSSRDEQGTLFEVEGVDVDLAAIQRDGEDDVMEDRDVLGCKDLPKMESLIDAKTAATVTQGSCDAESAVVALRPTEDLDVDGLPEDDVMDLAVASHLVSSGALMGDKRTTREVRGGSVILQDHLERVSKAIGILRAQQRASSATELNVSGNLTLCRYFDAEGDDTIAYMRWRKFGTAPRQAQLLFADEFNKVKFSVASRFPYRSETSWNGMKILHPDCGIYVTKPKYMGRPDIPTDIIQLKAMWEAALRNAMPNRASSSICEACSTFESDTRGGIYECSVCLTSCHEACFTAKMETCRAEMGKRRKARPPTFTKIAPEFVADRALCSVCIMVRDTGQA